MFSMFILGKRVDGHVYFVYGVGGFQRGMHNFANI